jgi:hypothetical protein
MKTPSYRLLFALPLAAFGLAVAGAAQPATTYYPSPESAGLQAPPKVNTDDIELMTMAPTGNAVILGELTIDGGPDASLHELMVAALNAAASKGADFVALAMPNTMPVRFLGKMVPAGHGRSMFVAGTVMGSEVGRIAAIPGRFPNSVQVVLGRYTR